MSVRIITSDNVESLSMPLLMLILVVMVLETKLWGKVGFFCESTLFQSSQSAWHLHSSHGVLMNQPERDLPMGTTVAELNCERLSANAQDVCDMYGWMIYLSDGLHTREWCGRSR